MRNSDDLEDDGGSGVKKEENTDEEEQNNVEKVESNSIVSEPADVLSEGVVAAAPAPTEHTLSAEI